MVIYDAHKVAKDQTFETCRKIERMKTGNFDCLKKMTNISTNVLITRLPYYSLLSTPVSTDTYGDTALICKQANQNTFCKFALGYDNNSIAKEKSKPCMIATGEDGSGMLLDGVELTATLDDLSSAFFLTLKVHHFLMRLPRTFGDLLLIFVNVFLPLFQSFPKLSSLP